MALLMKPSAPSRYRARLSRCGAVIASLLLATAAQAAPVLEDAVKATYVYKFAPFVTWPSAPRGASFDLCVDGSDTVSALLSQTTAGQQIGGQPIAVRAVSAGSIPAECRVLYVASGNMADGALDGMRSRPLLTITNGGDSVHGIITLRIVEQHVRFDIDLALAAQAGLTISSKLLSLARVVSPAKGDSR